MCVNLWLSNEREWDRASEAMQKWKCWLFYFPGKFKNNNQAKTMITERRTYTHTRMHMYTGEQHPRTTIKNGRNLAA